MSDWYTSREPFKLFASSSSSSSSSSYPILGLHKQPTLLTLCFAWKIFALSSCWSVLGLAAACAQKDMCKCVTVCVCGWVMKCKNAIGTTRTSCNILLNECLCWSFAHRVRQGLGFKAIPCDSLQLVAVSLVRLFIFESPSCERRWMNEWMNGIAGEGVKCGRFITINIASKVMQPSIKRIAPWQDAIKGCWLLGNSIGSQEERRWMTWH